MTHVPVTVAPNTIKAVVATNYQIPLFVYEKYPLYKKSFCTTIVINQNSNKDVIDGLIHYLQAINPEPVVAHTDGDFYPLYKTWCEKYKTDPTTETTFLLDYRYHLPSEEDLIYLLKLFDQKPVHFIIVGEFDTLPRIFSTNADLIYLETFYEFNSVNGKYMIQSMTGDVFLILDRRSMDLLIWLSQRQEVLKYL